MKFPLLSTFCWFFWCDTNSRYGGYLCLWVFSVLYLQPVSSSCHRESWRVEDMSSVFFCRLWRTTIRVWWTQSYTQTYTHPLLQFPLVDVHTHRHTERNNDYLGLFSEDEAFAFVSTLYLTPPIHFSIAVVNLEISFDVCTTKTYFQHTTVQKCVCTY